MGKYIFSHFSCRVLVQSGFMPASAKALTATSPLSAVDLFILYNTRFEEDKKKTLLNYSFCRVFFFFKRDPKFVAQKIFVIIIMYFVGALSSFMNIERTRSPLLRSLNRTLHVYHHHHRHRKALFNI